MESIIQTGMKRRDYYEGTIIDIRKIFIGYGRFLERFEIEAEGTLEDYETYLMELDKQSEQQRQDEHLEFICWILEQKNFDNDIMIIKGEEYDRFMDSNIEDDEMNMIIVNAENFYSKFKETTNVNLIDIDNFLSMTYIDEGRNDIEIILNIDRIEERFIIGI